MKNKLEKLKRVLDQIEKQEGMITPQSVVERARNENSPIHDMFDWNDTSAAEKYRIWQARQYIKDITVEIVGQPSQGFFNVMVSVEDVKTQGYFSTEKVLSDEVMKKAVLKEALSKLLYWKRLYKDFSELSGLVNIDKAEALYKEL